MSFHIEANKGEIAKIVFISGDPLRAKYAAETYLEEAFCYNEIRGMLGFTGYFNGIEVSVQGTGMGMPSTAIYAHELIQEYGVETIIRLGSCGAIQENIELSRIICATSAAGDSSMIERYVSNANYTPVPDFDLLKKAIHLSEEHKNEILFGPIFSSDCFYDPRQDPDRWKSWTKHGVLGVEMESQILYTIASHYGVSALSLLTVSDNILNGNFISSEARESSFGEMIEFALQLATS